MDNTDNTPDPYAPVWPEGAVEREEAEARPMRDLRGQPTPEPAGQPVVRQFDPGTAQVRWDRPPALDPHERRPVPSGGYAERPWYPPGPPPAQGAAVKGHNPGLTFLGMSGGILALVASAVILLFCVAPVVFCFGLGIIGAATPTPSPSF